jgi:hypothetical protein
MSVVGYEKGEDDRRTMSQEKEERGACKFVGEQGREKRHSGITPQKWETRVCACACRSELWRGWQREGGNRKIVQQAALVNVRCY